MKQNIRVAVIGCGYFGRMHAEVYKAMQGVDLAYVVDINENVAKYVADTLGTKYSTDYKDVICQDNIDVVDICLPDNIHADAVLRAVEYNKHILIEKPLADDLSAAKMIYSACKDYHKKVMVAHICRFETRYEHAYEAISSGKIGELIYISAHRNSPTLGAHRYAKTSKLITHSGIHDLDLVRWFTGSDFSSVYAVGRKIRMQKEGYKDCLDSIQAIYTMKNGITFSLENTWALPDAFPSYIDAHMNIVGSKGAIVIDYSDQGYKLITNESCKYEDVSFWTESNGLRIGAIKSELLHFIKCVQNDLEPRVSISDGYRAAVASIRTLESIEKCEIVLF